MIFSLYERNIILPLLHQWGFFTNALEFPKLGSVKFSFRVNRKEFVFILTFLSFFFKCFFLDQYVSFKLKGYSSLFFEIEVKKKNKDFFFFFIIATLLFNFLNVMVNIKKNITKVGNKKKGYVVMSTSQFFLFIHEVFNIGFFYYPNNDFMYHVYNLFQNIFYSTRSISLNLTIFLSFNIEKKFSKVSDKIMTFYGF